MKAGTSPAITDLPGSGYEVASGGRKIQIRLREPARTDSRQHQSMRAAGH
jgi:hypothetical protein